ncbi:MAG: hypothetical protein CVV27_15925, partial [Candidatus Melainabacteria bacterium HGW-Melainabacteria-1]
MRQHLLICCLLALCLLPGCASRQVQEQSESAEIGLVLLAAQPQQPLTAELDALFKATAAQLTALPERTRGWLSPLASALSSLQRQSLELARTDTEPLARALAPYRTLARYPIGIEQIKVPADHELAPVVIQANQQLRLAWHVNGAIWLAENIEPLLQQELRSQEQRSQVSRIALGVAAVSQLHLLLQAAQDSAGLVAALEESQRLTALRLDIHQTRLRANPHQGRLLRDEIEL